MVLRMYDPKTFRPGNEVEGNDPAASIISRNGSYSIVYLKHE